MTGLELMDALSSLSHSTLSREVTTLLGDVWVPVADIEEAEDEGGDLWPVIKLASTTTEEDAPAMEPIDDHAPESLAIRGALHTFNAEIVVPFGTMTSAGATDELLRRGWIEVHHAGQGDHVITEAGRTEHERIRYMPYGGA